MEKVGKWLEENHPHGNNQYSGVALKATPKMPVNEHESSNSRLVIREPELKEEIVSAIVEKGNVITPNKVANGIRKEVKTKIKLDPEPENNISDDTTIEELFAEEVEVKPKPKCQ